MLLLAAYPPNNKPDIYSLYKYSMDYYFKYAKASQPDRYKPGGPGRPIRPEEWCTGEDPVRHDKYYAWLKHRAQAKFRKEDYDLTWEDWESLWTDELWFQRGRAKTDLCLGRLDHLGPWSLDNCHVIPREEHLKRQGEFVRVRNV